MSQIAAWFERKFAAGFPVELMPNLLTRLRGTPARLEKVLGGRSREALTAKPEGKWSAQENAGHLLVLEPLWLARVEDFVTGSEQLTPTDLRNRRTDEADFNSQRLEDVLGGFRAARAALLARIDQVHSSAFELAIPHPRLKMPMRLADHLFFVAEHDDHHLARIWEMCDS